MINFYMEKLQESVRNTFKDILSGNISPRTIQTKLKENISNLTQQNIPTNTSSNMADTMKTQINSSMNSSIGSNIADTMKTQMNIPSIAEKTVGFSKWNIFKIVFAVIIIGVLALNAYTYITNGTDAFTYFLGNDEEKKPKSKDTAFETSNNVSDDKATTAIHSSIDIEAEKLSRNEKNNSSDIEQIIKKKNKNKKAYKANNLSNNINKKVGYCYIGSDRNVRTCVKVGESDTCMSGEVFPTRDICINPNLKE